MSRKVDFSKKIFFRGLNTEIALRKAKENVEKHYAVVGVLEVNIQKCSLPWVYKKDLCLLTNIIFLTADEPF